MYTLQIREAHIMTILDHIDSTCTVLHDIHMRSRDCSHMMYTRSHDTTLSHDIHMRSHDSSRHLHKKVHSNSIDSHKITDCTMQNPVTITTHKLHKLHVRPPDS